MSSNKYHKRRPRKKKNNLKKILLVVALVAVVAVIIVGYTMLNSNNVPADNNEPTEPTEPAGNEDTSTKMKVLFETSKGDILIQLRDDMPITTTNFKNLVQSGTYDNTIFHRVVNLPNNLVIIQGGDPNGNGLSDDSIPTIQDEFSDTPTNNMNTRGTISMANAGPNTATSQFFINGAYNSHLDNIHPVFGEVIEGIDVVDKILDVETSGDPYNQPLVDITLIKATLVD